MSAHRDFCRPPTRIDLSAYLEFLVSAITRHSLVREPFIPEPTSASTRTTCWPVAAAHPDSLATWRSRSPFWSLGGHPSVQA